MSHLQVLTQHKIVSSRVTNSTKFAVPRIVTLGGDHTTTLSALRSTYRNWGAVSVIHFDSHIGTYLSDCGLLLLNAKYVCRYMGSKRARWRNFRICVSEQLLSESCSRYPDWFCRGINHGTFLHIAHEEGLIRNTSIHAGIRAPVANKHYDLRNDKACGFDMIRARDIDRLTPQGVINKLKDRVGGSKVYISVDIDVLDPAYAPGELRIWYFAVRCVSLIIHQQRVLRK